MTKKRKGRNRWLDSQLRDPYVRRAHREGLRSRAAFKLSELLETEKLLRPGMTVVDLGAAPGGWSQYVASTLAGQGRVLAVDVIPMASIPGVEFFQGDFGEEEVLRRLLEHLAESKVDLVMSDMAPNISGVRSVDQARALYLAELAMDFAYQVLVPGGALLVKLFQGEGFDEYLARARRGFASARIRKPRASRSRSREVFLVTKGYRSGEEP